MKEWKIAGAVGIVLLILLVYSCKSDPGFTNYRQGMFYGFEALQNGQLSECVSTIRAGEPGRAGRSGCPPHWQGRRPTRQAIMRRQPNTWPGPRALDPNQSSVAYLIVAGYQALLAFRESRRQEGMTSLAYYIKLYKDSYPDRSLEDVKTHVSVGGYQPAGSGVADQPGDEPVCERDRSGLLVCWK